MMEYEEFQKVSAKCVESEIVWTIEFEELTIKCGVYKKECGNRV